MAEQLLPATSAEGGLPWWLRWQSICLQCRRPRFNPWVRKIPWRRKWQPTPLFLLGEFQGQRSLAGYSPWGCKESDTTERLPHLHKGTRGPACCGHQLQQSRVPSTQDPAVQHSGAPGLSLAACTPCPARITRPLELGGGGSPSTHGVASAGSSQEGPGSGSPQPSKRV